ncbi:MAG: ACP S-malonyltransferase [Vulcanimicrobiaceae bacterium]
MRVAVLFPGQGSQHPGMFERLLGDPAAEDAFEEARGFLGHDVRGRDHTSTVDVQLALLVSGVASARLLAAHRIDVHAVAGHSVGTFAAAVAVGALAFADALRVVLERATAMEELFVGGYGMAAIVGLREAAVRSLVAAGAEAGDQVFIANANAPSQFVLAGDDAALDRAVVRALASGAHRAERLDVAVPSHCTLLRPVQDRLERALAGVEIQPPRIAYVGSVGARILRDAQSIRADLAAGVAHEVRWCDALRALVELGTTVFIEAVPGRILTDLAQAAFPGVRAVSLQESSARSLAALGTSTF